MTKKVITHIIFPVLMAGLVLLGLLGLVRAATGNIDEIDKWVWSTNAGWINFDPEYGGVTVYNDHLEGYAWGENIGCIRMGTYTGGFPHTYTNTTKTDYGVNRDSSGNLSGYAWSTNVGWIKFDPSKATMDSTGVFSGYAWGESVGWIHLNKTTDPAYGVVAHICRLYSRADTLARLIVSNVTASSSAVTVTIVNTGTATVVAAFWVDVYVNPGPAPPALNQPGDLWWELPTFQKRKNRPSSLIETVDLLWTTIDTKIAL
ncbi:MAG: hypothetical protein GY869_15505 [Planctomycetes bacterium]|nr:hypothetical protein [Planctomycetota bacterium]